MERRRAPRILVEGYLGVRTTPDARAFTLLDVSAGGFLAASRERLLPEEMLAFDFVSREEAWSVTLLARRVHCHERTWGEGGAAEFVHGFVFISPEIPAVAEKIDRLLDYAIGTVDVDVPI